MWSVANVAVQQDSSEYLMREHIQCARHRGPQRMVGAALAVASPLPSLPHGYSNGIF